MSGPESATSLCSFPLSSSEYGTEGGLGKLGAGIRIWANINPDLLLAAFLPALLFESAFSMEAHQIKKCMVQMILLAGPGVLMSTFLLGTALKLTFPYDWDWKISLLLGGLLSATDPVAVVAHLKELGTSKKLSTIIEGESLMNDGVSVVVYQLFYRMVLGRSFNAESIMIFLTEVSLGGVALGLAFGIISLLWLGCIFNDTILEMTLTLAVSYLAFYTVSVNIFILLLSGDNEIARIVIDESNAMGEEARKFLEEVRCTFPQLLCVLKTRQVTYSVLTHLSKYVQNLRKTGLLEEKEMIQLDDALQTDLKKLKRNPPLVKMSVSDLLDTHPLVGVLPAVVRAHLLHNTKETVKGHDTSLYMEGSSATGIWIISTGLVKWTSQRLSSMYSLDPILSHGSTLGLYEVLTGKPYICNMIADSFVRCFFIEAEKIDQLRWSDPSVEALLWQESALVVAKLLIPRVFERITTHETRLVIAKGSTMSFYTEGEDIVLEHNQIGILLEGLAKAENQNSIASPGVLLPSNIDLELLGLQPSGTNDLDYCYAANSYEVQARARVIIFEAGRLLAEANLQRSSPSLTLSGEHGGLLSWPESSQESTSLAAARNQEGDSLSAKALHLGLYGSTEESTGEDVIVTIDSPGKPSLGKSPGGAP